MYRKSCVGCYYYGYESGPVLCEGPRVCDYAYITGKRRPCKPGEGCTVRREIRGRTARGRDSKEPKPVDVWPFPLIAVETLYRKGYRDEEIAETLRIPPVCVKRWRKERGRESTYRKTCFEEFHDYPEQIVVCLNCKVPVSLCVGKCTGGECKKRRKDGASW